MEALRQAIARWYEDHKRSLPWRDDSSPYHVWLSEVILQQTRVNQGLDYYLRFTERWPTLANLAAASEEEVLKMWQGLGYYSRARNLHRCAKEVMERHGGSFPADHKLLLQLPGIGGYTAAAIASIAFGLPHAVVDGNVYRVLARLYDIETPINNKEGVTLFADLADRLLDQSHPGRHNQALMEFGALQCIPQHPDCHSCPIAEHCLALARRHVEQRPVKEKRITVKTRYLHYLRFLTPDHKVYLHKREENDIWKNLYDFPCIEGDHPMPFDEFFTHPLFLEMIGNQNLEILKISPPYKHKLTHQTLIATFFTIKINNFLFPIQTKKLLLVPENELGSFPVPKLIENYLKTNCQVTTNNQL